jgi:hypothetical protein
VVFENAYDRDRHEIRKIRRLHEQEQQSGLLYEQAMAITIDEALFDSWWRFVEAGRAHRQSQSIVEVEGELERTKPTFDLWKQQIEGLREHSPSDFLQKCVIWRMSYADYLRQTDEIIREVSQDLFDRLDSGFDR